MGPMYSTMPAISSPSSRAKFSCFSTAWSFTVRPCSPVVPVTWPPALFQPVFEAKQGALSKVERLFCKYLLEVIKNINNSDFLQLSYNLTTSSIVTLNTNRKGNYIG